MEIADAEIAQAALSGDKDAFGKLITRYKFAGWLKQITTSLSMDKLRASQKLLYGVAGTC